MSVPPPPESEILKTVLEPLLEDFLHWFSRSRSLLESEPLDFLTESDRLALLEKIKITEGEVRATQMLFRATEGKAGIDPSILVPWHRLVIECWQVSARQRQQKQNNTNKKKDQ